MSAQIIQLPVAVRPVHNDRFGNCTICKRRDAILNVNRVHFGVCHRHRVCWCIGSNLFDSWRHESEATWRRNDALLRTYDEDPPI